jgi:ribulose-5-phosphate 4-epimerase/fuculose-1-phosphate aldolase
MEKTFSAYSPEEQTLREQLTYAYHLCALLGWDDLIYTHLSVRIPSEPDCYLINPFGLLFNEVTPDNLLKVNIKGEIIGPNPYNYNPAGENVHSAIYEARNDVNAVIHLHTLNGMALSALKDGLLPICQHSCHFYGRIAYHDYQGIAVEKEEQEVILEDMGDKDILIMRNHGFLTVGPDLAHAFCEMYTLEKAATVQLMALSSGREIILPTDTVCEKVINQTRYLKAIKNYHIEWDALVRLLKQKTNPHSSSPIIFDPSKRMKEETFSKSHPPLMIKEKEISKWAE